MTAFLDLFSGIGGFALAAYWVGLRFDRHYFSEIEPYAVKLYKKRFPEAEFLGDIKNVDYSKLPKGEWLVTGGFPCQPHSVAGKRKASEDERDLWAECKRALRELRPRIALFENVTGLLVSEQGRFFNGVLSDISEVGYACEWQVISAADVGAPHLRKRVWIVAYAQGWEPRQQAEWEGRENSCGGSEKKPMANADDAGSGTPRYGINIYGQEKNEGREKQPQPEPSGLCENTAYAEGVYAQGQHNGQGQGEFGGSGWWKFEPSICVLVDGLPAGLGGYEGRVCAKSFERVNQLKGLGNAIVPQCAEMIFNLPAFDRWRTGGINGKTDHRA